MSKPATAVWPGRPYPLGAAWDGQGVNFALFSEHASKVELCLYDSTGRHELQRVPLAGQTDQIWHAYLPEVLPGQQYGYRVHGPYAPEKGHRFNPNKLLIDPYARAIVGVPRWSDAQFGYRIGSPLEDLSFSRRDSGFAMPKSMVIDAAFDWGNDRHPRTPWHETVIYEMHVKGFTRRHPEVPPHLQGTYAGLACPAVIEYLKRLGVTAVELLPIHSFVDDRMLLDRGLRNYWGYNSIGYFALEQRYSASGGVTEFKQAVKTLHAAGIEVILDVVYNHTAEGNHCGPTLCFRGIDNLAYYRLVADNPRYYMDYTGCGNTLNMMHPKVLQLIMDSLRYWVTEMHVDGFRFDLAAALARELHEVDQLGAFMDIIHQDPILSHVKLIAEPWDIGEGGYQVGNFPPGWTEWNGRYRDVIRDYWRGEGGLIGQLAYRLTGSSDLYQHNGRSPAASINFITAHDGFTLYDLVSYNEKHNEANGENNQDGEAHNRSWNCGVEGGTDDSGILALRLRQRRNFLASLLLSQGVPMLTAGDEAGRTQRGNNNAYCQDNEISWFDWNVALLPENRQLFEFVSRLIRLRHEHPALRRRDFFQGRGLRGVRDIIWLNPDGTEVDDEQWTQSHVRCIGMYLVGEALEEQDASGHWLLDDDFLLLLNAHYEAIPFTPSWNSDCEAVFDTALSDPPPSTLHRAGQPYPLQGRSLALLRRPRPVVNLPREVQPLARRHSLPFGVQFLEGGRLSFRLFAPKVNAVDVLLNTNSKNQISLPMEKTDDGWFQLTTAAAKARDRYAFRLDRALTVPDPASRFNPEGAQGESQVVDPGEFDWQDVDWRGRPFEESVLYQLHVGTFSPQGTFAAVRERLHHLAETGITALLLMPVGETCGSRSWGHETVLPFAPKFRYGPPEELKLLVQTAHLKGLMVFLETPFRLGREGNSLPSYAPALCSDEGNLNGGLRYNLKEPNARSIIVNNALYWLNEFHFDGLSMSEADVAPNGDTTMLDELCSAISQGPGRFREVHLLIDNGVTARNYLLWDEKGGPRQLQASWNEPLLGVLQPLLRGETGEPVAARLGEALAGSGGVPAGDEKGVLPAVSRVSYLQNHSSFGREPMGERIHQMATSRRGLEAVTALLLLSPAPPLLFMGQEFAADQPFLYFSDFKGDLRKALDQKWRRRFAGQRPFHTARGRARIPAPNNPATFERCILDWKQLDEPGHIESLRLHRDILGIRRREITPRLRGMVDEQTRYEVIGEQGLLLRWVLGDDSLLTAVINIGDRVLEGVSRPSGSLLYGNDGSLDEDLSRGFLNPWSLGWFLETRE